MAWNDRLKDARYISPLGVINNLNYENVSKTIEKKTTGFEFPDADGTLVQDLGHTGRRYPLKVFFWGDNYDLEANVFEESLLERGPGKLEHPLYGTINVVPFGTLKRRDDLKSAANQAVYEVTFWETIDVVYPSGQEDPASKVISAINEYNAALADEFDENTDLDSAVSKSSFKNSYKAFLDTTSSTLQAVADTQNDVSKQFNAIDSSINNGIDILINKPRTLAFQTTQLIQAPGRAITSISARLDAYFGLSSGIISGDNAIAGSPNDFYTSDLYASTYVTGSVISVVNNTFETRSEALEAAEALLAQLENVNNWKDENLQALGLIDIGGSYQQLQDAVALAAGFLVDISFSLKQERSVTLDRDRTIIDLAAELYGSVDDQLDFLINSNGLSGSEILELPRGREIVYYV